MNNERNKYILAGLILLVITGGYFILKDNLTEWNYNLDKAQKNPYGTYLSYHLIKERYSEKGFTEINNSVVESFRKLKKNASYNYIFLNETPYYDSATVDTLCKFAEAGNTVFISCESLYGIFPDSVLYKTYHLKLTTGYSETYHTMDADSLPEYKKTSRFNFTHPGLKDKSGYTYYIKYQADTLGFNFYKFTAIPDSERIQPVPAINRISYAGYENSYGNGYNFAELRHGKGKFVILLSALPFTNYFMRTEKGLEYAEKVFAHLPDRPVLWDNISSENNISSSAPYHGDSSFGESPLYFILNNISLRRAWYLTIIGIIIYALFHAKRRQNVIPVIEPKQNTSLRYVETIGQLYFHEEEHIEIAHEMRQLFLNYIRQKYHLRTHETDALFIRQLALTSTIDEEKVTALFDSFKDIVRNNSIPQQKLHHLNRQLEYFYKNCK